MLCEGVVSEQMKEMQEPVRANMVKESLDIKEQERGQHGSMC
jgi:hypothetical protein